MEKVASSRSFGLLFAAFFAGLGALNYWGRGHWYAAWAGASAILLVTALVVPRLLAPLKRLWLRLGHLLNVAVSPVILGLVYVLAIVPVGLLIRLSGKDLLGTRRVAAAPSYWIRRASGGPAPQSLKDQF